uniref:Uncharacterized protein n=1 Tax=Timema cristinae TaxID=61476 RepID=A0A7R9D5J6_TIMCR|nr:unnamed protein product [Timema cristinae]
MIFSNVWEAIAQMYFKSSKYMPEARYLKVKEGFGNQINLCRDRGLNPKPPAHGSNTLALDHQIFGSEKSLLSVGIGSALSILGLVVLFGCECSDGPCSRLGRVVRVPMGHVVVLFGCECSDEPCSRVARPAADGVGTPYIVREIGYADFYGIKDLHDRYIGPSQQLLKHVKIGDIKVLKVEKSKPATLMYKTSYSDYSFKEVNVAKPNLRRSKSSMSNEEFEPKRAFTEKLPLSDK